MATTTAPRRSDLTISGMSCAGCASKVQTELVGLDGVIDAQVNFATARATVHHGEAISDGDLTAAIERVGYQVVAADDFATVEDEREDDLRQRLIVAALLATAVMAISMIRPLQFSGWEWVAAALTTPVVFGSGAIFHRNAVRNLRHRTTTMDTLVSMGTLAAWSWSAVVLVADIDGGHIYFETAAMIVALILLGKWFESRAKRRSGAAIRALADLGAPEATLVDGRVVSVDRVVVGDRFLVKPGERIATDGVVVEGAAAVDMAMVSGEPVPVDVSVGDEVVGATINTNGSLVVEATRVGADTALAQIIRLVDEAQGSRAEVQRLADRVAAVFVPAAILAALVTLAAWLVFSGDVNEAFTACVAVLIIACPCALGLATPLGIMVGTGRGAQLGVIIKGGEILEDTRRVDIAVLDKTGTVTEGAMVLADTFGPPAAVAAVAPLAAALEARSEHPIARAIAAGFTDHPPVADFVGQAGFGVSGTVGGESVAVGKRALFSQISQTLDDQATQAEAQGRTVVLAGRDGTAEIGFVVADTVKPTSVAAIEALHQQGLRVMLLTGDNARTAQRVGESVGVDEVRAEVLPDDKAAVVRELQEAGHRVAMVGDGINDAPALAQADLGIAVGTGTDVAIEASDLTIVSGDLRAVADAIALSRRTLGTIKGNLFWAFAYNAAAIPLAAAGVLNPMIAAAAMGVSSIFVVSNSLRLRRFVGYRARA